jgi:diguanylate cyclase (GGDEF)-like protein
VAARRGRPTGDAATDPVTGFGTREHLLADLRSALRAAVQHRMPVALMLLEVAGLGSRRSGKGRRAADQSLAAVAAVLGRRIRVGDIAYRFGHDEIAVLLPLTDAQAAEAVTRRMTALPLEPDPGAGDPESHVLKALDGTLALRAAWVPVEGKAEDVALNAGRALAAAGRRRKSRPRPGPPPRKGS